MSDKQTNPKDGAADKDAAPLQLKREFTLPFGYQDLEDKDKLHRRVVIARRPIAKDFFFDVGDSDVLFDVLMEVAAITEFGDMKMPVPQTVLLSLNKIDREKIKAEMVGYMTDTLGKRETKHLGTGKVKLSFGVTIDSVVYDTIEFGTLLNGYDEIEIEKTKAQGWHKILMTMGKEVIKISQSGGQAERTGSVTIKELENLDFFDLVELKECEDRWLDSFRS